MSLLSGDDPAAIQAAAQRLADCGLVALPTETVYGLGARADDDAAVAAIFAAKGRPSDHPLIVHVADWARALPFIDQDAAPLPAALSRLIHAFWPGPVTVIVARAHRMGSAAAAGLATIGLRCPAHPVALAVLRAAAALGVPGVAAPSANRFGRVSPTTAAHVLQEFGPGLCVIDGGACALGIESTIVDCTGAAPALLRPGQLLRVQIESVLGRSLLAPGAGSPRASGTLESHYAPAAAVRLWDSAALRQRLQAPPGPAEVGVAVYSRLVLAAQSGWVWRAMPSHAAAAAHELFLVLRELDDSGVKAIWVERPPLAAEWDGVRDRLVRAAAT